MNIVITGSRTIKDKEWVETILQAHFSGGGTMISGACRTGVDAICENWAGESADIPLKLVPADWEQHGRAAGPIRNKEMVRQAGSDDMVVAFWDGKSRGTKSTIDFALQAGVELHVYVYNDVVAKARAGEPKIAHKEIKHGGTVDEGGLLLRSVL